MILGAGGQLGTELVRVFSDCRTTALRHEDCDVADYESVMSAAYACGPELVLNASAMNRVDDCETERDAAFAVNAVGPRNLALAARRLGATLVHVSTDYVFDGNGAPYDEWAAPNPINEYGRSKLAGEIEVSRLLPESYVVRTAVVLGATGRNFARTMLDLARASDAPVDVVDDVIGSPTHAGYLAEAIRRMAVSGRFGLYHVAGGGACSRAELARAVFIGAGHDPSRVRGVPSISRPEAARRPVSSALEGRAWRLAGFPPVPPWEEHVDRLLRELGVSAAPARVPAPGGDAPPAPVAQPVPPAPVSPQAVEPLPGLPGLGGPEERTATDSPPADAGDPV